MKIDFTKEELDFLVGLFSSNLSIPVQVIEIAAKVKYKLLNVSNQDNANNPKDN